MLVRHYETRSSIAKKGRLGADLHISRKKSRNHNHIGANFFRRMDVKLAKGDPSLSHVRYDGGKAIVR